MRHHVMKKTPSATQPASQLCLHPPAPPVLGRPLLNLLLPSRPCHLIPILHFFLPTKIKQLPFYPGPTRPCTPFSYHQYLLFPLSQNSSKYSSSLPHLSTLPSHPHLSSPVSQLRSPSSQRCPLSWSLSPPCHPFCLLCCVLLTSPAWSAMTSIGLGPPLHSSD